MASRWLQLLSATLFWPATGFDSSNNKTTSCDDILLYAFPDLCELEVIKGSIQVRGLRLTYWRYRAAGGAAHQTKDPVLTVHGGPAFSHDYLLPLKQLACRGREVVFYDQVGCGESSVPPNPQKTAPWLFTLDYYIEEVRALLDEFGWSAFHLFGHSWGTVVGQVFGFTQDPRLLSLILAGPLSDAQLYIKAQWDERQGSVGTLPSYIQHVLKELSKDSAYETPLYEAEDSFLSLMFTVRTFPVPDCCLKSAMGIKNKATQEIYVGMQGASEFTIGGVLEHMNLTGRLWSIERPVLLLRGEFDTMRPPCVNALYDALPHAWRAVIPRAAHCSMVDEPKLVNDVAGEFFERVEDRRLENLQSWIEEATGQMPEKANVEAMTSATSAGHWEPSLRMLLTCILCTLIGLLVGSLIAGRDRGKGKAWAQRNLDGNMSPFLRC